MVNLAPPKSKQELERYIKWLNKHSIKFRVLSPGDQVDGTLVLSGGGDIGKDKKRDRAELAYLEQALSNGFPILGICRGMQLVNLYFFGTVRNVKIEENHCSDDFETEHGNHVKPSVFHTVKNEYDLEMLVNSRHHQCCSILSQELKAIFWAPDKTIEAAVSANDNHDVLLVQWHPERKETRKTKLSSNWPANWLKNKSKISE
jgi:gamma-glutamyl-gamma-aminobutyrate hydrolase PuuD